MQNKIIGEIVKQEDKRYRLELTLDSPDIKEMIYTLSQLADSIARYGEQARFRVNSTQVELSFTKYNEVEYRVEEINGKLCYVFKSKMK